MDKETIKPIVDTTTLKVDDTGGISKSENRIWFVAVVNNHSEKKYSKILHNLGYEVFVPIQSEERTWRNGTVKVVDRILIAATIFVRCKECERIDILKRKFAKRFMVDHTKRDQNGKHPVAIIPDCQIESFRTFIEQTDEPIEIIPIPYRLGETVKVVNGKFKGLVGNVVQYSEGRANLVICLGVLGCAKLNIESNLVSRV